jgi:hypothetical protein
MGDLHRGILAQAVVAENATRTNNLLVFDWPGRLVVFL